MVGARGLWEASVRWTGWWTVSTVQLGRRSRQRALRGSSGPRRPAMQEAPNAVLSVQGQQLVWPGSVRECW